VPRRRRRGRNARETAAREAAGHAPCGPALTRPALPAPRAPPPLLAAPATSNAPAGSRSLINTFAVPTLRVGSLDSLMTLSDELARADSFCESVLKKAERAVGESYVASKQNEARAAAGGGGGGGSGGAAAAVHVPPLGFYCSGKGVARYIEAFTWDTAKWDVRDALPDLLKKLLESAEKVDADLRAVVQAYSDKKTAWVAADRKRRCAGGWSRAARCAHA
jgi:hypothetical protein